VSDPTPVFDDLREESEELDRLVAELSAEQWALATPAPGWSVAHQIAHLAWTDHSALLAATDTDAYTSWWRRRWCRRAPSSTTVPRRTATPGLTSANANYARWSPTPASRSTKTRRRS
jgi:uncharacterized protein (TIGR03083 family)